MDFFMVSGGLGLSLDPLLHSLGGLRMRSESTHQPTHTPTDSLFRPTRATLPTTDSMGRPELLRQVSRRQDHRDLGTRAKRLALALLGREICGAWGTGMAYFTRALSMRMLYH